MKIFIIKHIKVFFFKLKKLRGNWGKITIMYLGRIIFSSFFLIGLSISTRQCCSLLTHIDDNKFITNIITYLFDNFETFSSYLNAYFNAEIYYVLKHVKLSKFSASYVSWVSLTSNFLFSLLYCYGNKFFTVFSKMNIMELMIYLPTYIFLDTYLSGC